MPSEDEILILEVESLGQRKEEGWRKEPKTKVQIRLCEGSKPSSLQDKDTFTLTVQCINFPRSAGLFRSQHAGSIDCSLQCELSRVWVHIKDS